MGSGGQLRQLRDRIGDVLAGLLVVSLVVVMTGVFVVTMLTIYANKRRIDAIEARIERMDR